MLGLEQHVRGRYNVVTGGVMGLVSDPRTVMCLQRRFISAQWKEGVTNVVLVSTNQPS